MRAIPTSVICNWFLAFAVLFAVIAGGVVIVSIVFSGLVSGLVMSLPVLLLAALGVGQTVSLYLVCKRGVKQEEGFRKRRH